MRMNKEKRWVDADLFLIWLSSQTHIDFIDDIAVRFIYLKYGNILEKINELSTTKNNGDL